MGRGKALYSVSRFAHSERTWKGREGEERRMSRRLTSVLAATALLTVLFAGSALAHPVGEPGTPSCFGERISHGSSDHGLTPVDRAAQLEEFVVTPALDGEFGPEIQQFALEFFGDDGVSVKEMTRWVRANCSDNPIVDE